MNLENKTVAITGGATGIGFALAKQFGALGANIVIGEPRPERLKQATDSLEGLGITAASTKLDVTDLSSVEEFAEFAWSTFGGVHLLINNAGIIGDGGHMTKQPMAKVHDVMNVNFYGVWHGSAVFGRRMVEQKEPAAIYNVGSENSHFVAAPLNAAYVASKHAVRGLTLAMKEEFPDFITIGVICPGFVGTELTPGVAEYGMDADRFASLVVKQILDEQFWVVSHAYNIERIKPIHEDIEQAFSTYAPRYAGDDEFDVPTLIEKLSRTSNT